VESLVEVWAAEWMKKSDPQCEGAETEQIDYLDNQPTN
jgi:hypothetical protein